MLRIICAVVNSLIPATFTTEVLLNDRWTINVALELVSDVFRVENSVFCEDLLEGDEEGVCSFLTYILLSGFQFRQAQAVGCKVKELKRKIEDFNDKLIDGDCLPDEIEMTKSGLLSLKRELDWLQAVYDTDACIEWMTHGDQVQAEVRAKIAIKMEERFEVIPVSRRTTINQLVENMGINLSFTGGNGFYLPGKKEKLWIDRKMVVRDIKSGEFFDDFSGKPNTKGSVRQMLDLHACDIVEVDPDHYPNYEIFLESASRNRILKGGSKLLYQVFPGTRGQCERLLHRAAREGEITAIKKLVIFFKDSKGFVNCREKESGSTALHLASRQGHFNVALFLLESGADVNLQNLPGCTPFFLATEHLHKRLSQLLLEWGADINIKNRNSKVALEITRNADLRDYLQEKYVEYQTLCAEVSKRNVEYVEKLLENHVIGRNPLVDLKCRCVRGSTLFHVAAALGSKYGLEVFFNQQVDCNLADANGATPLHVATDPAIIQYLLDHEVDVNACDKHGNTPLHMVCGRQAGPVIMQDIRLLVKHRAQLDLANQKNWLPIHCAVASGHLAVVQLLLELDEAGLLNFLKEEDKQDDNPGTLLCLAVSENHLEPAVWLSSVGFRMKVQEADRLMSRILHGELSKCGNPIDTVTFLLQQGASPNAVYSKKIRPLHLTATLIDLPELTSLLLDAGAEVNPRDSAQATPLFGACKSSNLFAAKFLLEKGADHHLRDSQGKCAFDYVTDHQEWIDSGHFTDDIRALLKAFSLRHARELVKSISKSFSDTVNFVDQ